MSLSENRPLLAGTAAIVLISSLIGNTLILIGSIGYKALNLHKTLVVIIRYIAVFDLTVTVSRVLPGLVSMLENKWVFGEFGCDLTFFVFYTSHATSCSLVAVLTTVTWLLIKYPSRAESWLKGKMAYVTLGVWLNSICVTTIPFLRGRDVHFSNWSYNCELSGGLNGGLFLWGGTPGFVVLVSYIWVVISSLLFIVETRNLSHESEKWRDLTTVLLISIIYCIFLLPVIASSFAGKDYLLSSLGSTAQILLVAPIQLVAMYKFHVYMLVLPKFRLFLKMVRICLVSWCGGLCDRVDSRTDSRENLLASQENLVNEEELGFEDNAVRNENRASVEVAASGRFLSREEGLESGEENIALSGNLVLNGQVYSVSSGRNERTGLQIAHHGVQDTTV